VGEKQEERTVVKMKRTDIPKVRKELINKQNGLCPICGKDLTRTKPINQVIDHDHSTGLVRAVLHRGCNKVEGSILSTVTRWGKASSRVAAIATLRRLADYWEEHTKPQTEWIYYNHKTAAEKRVALNKKRRKAYARKNN
jgi:hypothetical protein